MRPARASIFRIDRGRIISHYIRDEHLSFSWPTRRCIHGHNPWVHLEIGGRQLRQRGYRYLLVSIHILPVDQSSQEWFGLVGCPHCTILRIHGFGLGRIRLHHQSAASTHFYTHLYGKIQSKTIRELQFMVHSWYAGEHASAFRGFPTNQEQRAYVRLGYGNLHRLPISVKLTRVGVFGLIQLVAFVEFVRQQVPSKQFQTLLRGFIFAVFAVSLGFLVLLTVSGVIAPWSGRFYSLWDTGYAKIHIPIIASVSEHQPTAWPAFFFDLNLLIWLFPAGVYMCFQNLKDEHVFVVIYAVLSSYFAGVMVRLMLTLTPVVCIAAALALSSILDIYLVADSPPISPQQNGDANGDPAKTVTSFVKDSLRSTRKPVYGIYSYISKGSIVTIVTMYLLLFVLHCTWVTSNAYSSPSVVLASKLPDGSTHIIDDYREAYYWLRQNTPEKAKIMSWWDYGYQIGGMADRPTLVDNNTWNNTHIATVGKAMSSREEVSYPILKQHDVDYVLIVFGGLLGYSGDDINKFLWMVRISEGIWPDEINERNYFTSRGEYRVDDEATPTMRNSLM